MENELMINQEKQIKTINSREVTEMVKVRHSDLLRDIRNLLIKYPLSSQWFITNSYINAQNKTQLC